MIGKFIASTSAAMLLAGLAIWAAATAQGAEPGAAAKLCALPDAVTVSITLDGACVYRGPLVINTSGVAVDCSGALIDARDARNGVVVKGANIRDVTIRNCTIEGAHGQGVIVEQPTNDADMAARPLEERYKLAPQNILLDNLKVVNSGSVGIYIDSYAQNVLISNSKILRSGGAGIYLEHSSRHLSIRDNVVMNNGFGDPLGRRKSGHREGIAVDSSAYNIIEGNTFSGNAAGGIFFYKNCWEHHSRPGTVRRWQHAAHNLVQGNLFENEEIGVWIASRQTRKLASWDCGDPEIAPGFYRDYANDNSVVGNRFVSVGVGVRVNDDDAKVTDNVFLDATRGCVELGSLRQDDVLRRPVRGVQLTGNRCDLKPAASIPPDEPVPAQRGFRAIGSSGFAICTGNELDDKAFACH
jgi:nitrous oxidase accessory protein NosD